MRRLSIVARPVRGTASRLEDDPLAAGRQWLARAEWDSARKAFARALESDESPEALEGLGMACWWLDDAAGTFGARERAFELYEKRGDRPGAARTAIWIARDALSFRGATAVAMGWLKRALRRLEGVRTSVGHAQAHWCQGSFALIIAGDTAAAQRHARKAVRVARAHGAFEIEMQGLALDGIARVHEGKVKEGMALLDEAAASALTGDLREPVAVALVCCYLIEACSLVRDFERAVQWCDQVKAFSLRWRFQPVLAICRIQHANVLTWRGAWEEAEAELRDASAGVGGSRIPTAATSAVRLAELRRRQGRWDEASALLGSVDTHSRAPLARAQLALDRGEPAEAPDLLDRFLRHLPRTSRTQRAEALELLVEARVSLGDVEAARRAARELRQTADAVATAPFQAAAAVADGLVAAARGDAPSARRFFEDAVDLYAQSGSPFESARARLRLAELLRDGGQWDRARAEADTALATFEHLGAKAAAERARSLIRAGTAGSQGSPLSRREREVMALVAEGLSNGDIGTRLFVSGHTVHRHVANILNKLSVSSRAAAVAAALRQKLV